MDTALRIRPWQATDLPGMIGIWNEVVEAGRAFPQEECLDDERGAAFFTSQTSACVGILDGKIVALYILHPNNIGRCGHLANASYAVAAGHRGQGIGEALVRHSLANAREKGFGVLQFNAVAKSNFPAHKLYRKLGFKPLGVIPGGFRNRDGQLEDIQLYYHDLQNLAPVR